MIHPYQFLEVHDLETTQFDLWLFHESKHLKLQSTGGWRTFVIAKKDEIVGQVRFHQEGNVARASLRSPFGTIQFVENLPADILFSFIQFFETPLKKSGVGTVILKNPPALYAPFQNELLSVSLLNQGYQISNAEVGAVIKVNTPFEKHLDEWELRKLKQAGESGLKSSAVELDKLEAIYQFILSCREEREQGLSLAYDELKKVVAIFPDRFILHTVQDGTTLAAAAIGIKINSQILYNFYSAHSKEYDSISPAVLLMKSLYEYCFAGKIELLDLGTSALDGKPNFGLLDFKMRLGAIPTAKYTFHKELR